MVSTFKYTNAVPQHTAFNTGPWKVYEQRVRKFALENCQLAQGDLFLLTGSSEVIIGNTAVKKPLKYFPVDNANHQANIAIPNSMWTAGCCLVNTVVHGAFAAIGNNNQLNNQMHQLTVEDLEKTLAKGIGGNAKIELFPAGNNRCSDNAVQFWYDDSKHERWREFV
jgi:DNA/RNA endonuclease G (NUC1)